MVADRQKRKERIQQFKVDPIEKVLIGELGIKNERFWVYKIPLDCLILNPLNSRFQVNLNSQTVKENQPYYYTENGQKEIKEWIWEQNTTFNKKTTKDLQEKGQQKPGVITADGLIINGNRRFVVMSKLFSETGNSEFASFNAVILENITVNDTQIIKEKEIRLQFGEDKKLDYSRINTMLAIRDFQTATNWNDKKIKTYFNWSGSIGEMRKTLEFIDDYKKYFHIKSYSLVEGTEDQFKYLSNSFDKIINYENNEIDPDWAPRDKDFYAYKFTMFKFLRMKPNQPDLRSMVKIDGQKNPNVFVKKTVWDNFKERIDQIYRKGKSDTNQQFIGKKITNPSPAVWEETFKKKTKEKMNELVIEKKQEILNLKAKNKQEKILTNLSKNIEILEEIASNNYFKTSSKKTLKKLANKLWHINNRINAKSTDNN